MLAVAFSLAAGASAVRSPEVLLVYERAVAPDVRGVVSVRPWMPLGIGLQASYQSRRGVAVLTSTMEPSSSEARLSMGTAALRLEGRAEFAEHQVLVPYLHGGPMVTWFREQVETEVIAGWKPGGIAGGGLAILLTPETSWSLQPHPRLEGIYLVAEGAHRWARRASGAGLDLGGWQVHVGVEVVVR